MIKLVPPIKCQGIKNKLVDWIKAAIPVVAGVDIDPACRYAFETNHEGARFIEADVTTLRASAILDLLIGRSILHHLHG